MAFSFPAGNNILNATVNNSAYNPSSRYFALFSTVPSESSSGTELPYANGYTRRGFDGIFTVASGNYLENTATIVWSATGVWSAAVVGIGQFDAGSAGTRIWQHTLTSSILVDSGDSVTWVAGRMALAVVSCQA